MSLEKSLNNLKNYKQEMFPKCAYVIEPKEPVESKEEILKEVSEYFNVQGKTISVIKEEPLPIITLEGKDYVVRTDRFVGAVGGGKKIEEPFPVKNYVGSYRNMLGYKCIYIYPVKK